VAELLGRVLQDTRLRATVLAGQAAAIARWRALDFGKLLLERLSPVLDGRVPSEQPA
jgi:hypothetical protein